MRREMVRDKSQRPGIGWQRASAAPRVESLETRIVLSIAPLTQDEVAQLLAYKAGPWAKVEHSLYELYQDYLAANDAGGGGQVVSSVPGVPIRNGNMIRIEATSAIAGDNQTLARDLARIGLVNTSVYGAIIDGDLPIASLEQASRLSSLAQLRAVSAFQPQTGVVNEEGDQAMQSDLARSTFGVSGVGVKVGVLSDSFNALGGYASDIRSGDLPRNVQILQDDPFGSDEGRAMLQIVHDVAPGSPLAFHTAFLGQADFANGILQLAQVGSRVIVDDVSYANEPFYSDGIIAQAVTAVYNQGVSYYSSAGNEGNLGYQRPFNFSGQNLVIGGQNLGPAHDFDPGPGVALMQPITIPGAGLYRFVMQWDQPFRSATNGLGQSLSDVDIFFLDSAGTQIVASGTSQNVLTGDPIEFVVLNNTLPNAVQLNVAITTPFGPFPTLMRWQSFGSNVSINAFQTNGPTIFGHANAAGAVGVGAAFFAQTPQFGVTPPVLESFSSLGPTPILFNTQGIRLPAPVFRGQPSIVGPDGVTTTVPGFAPFFGTSAAAPNVAAVAALMLDANPFLSPSQIYATQQGTAIPMIEPFPGRNGTGAGFIDAFASVSAVFSATIVLTPVNAANAIGQTHSVTATVTNAVTGAPVSGAGVNFTVVGANPLTATVQSDATGHATLTYVGTNIGDDFIQANITVSLSNQVHKLWTLPSSIAGTCYVDLNNDGMFEVGEPVIPYCTITLTGFDAVGAPMTEVDQSDINGNFLFSFLTNGTYTLIETQPAAYFDGSATPGTAGGVYNPAVPNVISGIVLAGGQNATGYLFGELGLRPEYISKRLFLSSTTTQVVAGDITQPQNSQPYLPPNPAPIAFAANNISAADGALVAAANRPAASNPFLVPAAATSAYHYGGQTTSTSSTSSSIASSSAARSQELGRSRSSREQAVDEALADTELALL